ncbi:Crotonobetainyl-CoA:carnitine CoA-transferase CaiB [Actinacidiphila yanglinensis]|uniref:Crotonobetainyl-CoA:carnitine CoA-transferase CaiB n=1 Tax=Actinacidiphila yanglinensis TaxID=310779 RepID=A0A1H6C4E6_9ACTN|nr:CoA transferase [Actinacidiphila yanglinensis]SEG67808.1 Crotonobetainyl-CoA:carnitine CoA-transferase CaiB [Actinacidiphila yanglinensis]
MTAEPAAPVPPRVLRVLELTESVAGGVCGRLFAGLGHDVVRVATDPADPLRHRAPLNADGLSLEFVAVHAGKRGLDAAGPDGGLPDVHRLLADADVLVLDATPSRARALGLDPGELAAAHPELVTVWITGFGPSGPYRDLPADSLLAESYGGLATMIGEAGRKPLALGGEQAAHCGAVTGFLGAMLGLLRRDAGQGGDLVEVALCDVAAYMDWKSDVNWSMTGLAPGRAVRDQGDWRLVRAADGWVGYIFLPRHWPAVVELIGDPALRDPALASEEERSAHPERWWPVIERWTAQLPAQEVYTRAQELGLPFGWVARTSDLAASEQLAGRGFLGLGPEARAGRVPAVGGPLHGAGLGWDSGRPPAPQPDTAWLPRKEPASRPSASRPPVDLRAAAERPPLDGLVVLDFGTITAGAAVTRLLADHGATILKVEWTDRPDTFRTWKLTESQLRAGTPPTSPYFPSNNIGKLDVAIDLKTAEGQRLVRELARHAHVVVENFRVGVTRRLGIDAATLLAQNPRLVCLSLSSQGQHGPEAGNRSFGSTLDLLSGLASVTGYPDRGPTWSSYEVNYPDQLVSLVGAAAVAYCVQQDVTGAELDLSQREAVSWTLSAQIADYVVNGHDARVTGNRRPGAAPHDTFPAAGEDSWLAVACTTDAHRAALAGWLGRPDLAGRDPAWWDGEEAAELVGAVTAALPRDEAAAALLAAGVPAVPVLTAADRAATARFTERGVTFGGDGPPVKGSPMVFARYSPAVRPVAPAIGEHTREVLTGLAGLAPDDVRRLEGAGAVHCARPAGPAGGDDARKEGESR